MSNISAAAARPRARRAALALICLAALAPAAAPAALAQTQRPGDVVAIRRGDVTLYGDFKVEKAEAAAGTPQNYHVILYALSGTMVSRQTVSNNGRYRFLNIPHGEYNLVVELDNSEVARIPLQVSEGERTDVRQDIVLEWRAAAGAGRAGAVRAPLYERALAGQALVGKAREAVGRKDYDEAVALMRRVVAADPKDFEAWDELGTLLYTKEELGEAEKAYRRATELRPSYAPALVNLGRVLVGRKDYAAAVAALEGAVAAAPDSADANHLLGEAHLLNRKGSLAVKYFGEALRLDPQGKADIHLRLATLYNAAGRKDLAAAEYEQFLSKRPGHPDRKKYEQYVKENGKQ